MTDRAGDELAASMEDTFESRNWRPGTVLRFEGRPAPNEYVIEEFVNDWFLLLIHLAMPHKRLRWEKSAFAYVRAVSSDELATVSAQADVLEVMTS